MFETVTLLLRNRTKLAGIYSLIYKKFYPAHTFTTDALRRGWGFNPHIFWRRKYLVRFYPTIPRNASSRENFKITTLPRMEPNTAVLETVNLLRQAGASVYRIMLQIHIHIYIIILNYNNILLVFCIYF